jgi:hypothetical protein
MFYLFVGNNPKPWLLKALVNEAFSAYVFRKAEIRAGDTARGAVHSNSPLTGICPGGIVSIPH